MPGFLGRLRNIGVRMVWIMAEPCTLRRSYHRMPSMMDPRMVVPPPAWIGRRCC